MRLSIQDWHQRYIQQAAWTRDLRDYLYAKYSLNNAKYVLDAGCGTGSILSEIQSQPNIIVCGVDIEFNSLRIAREFAPATHLAQADIHHLPVPDQTIDICLLHYVLLWVSDPLHCLRELRRVTRSGGCVLAIAEPDYGGRIDYPEDLAILGQWQRDSLQIQGADPTIGRELRSLFNNAGIVDVECGVIGAQWLPNFNETDWLMEWALLENDIEILEPVPRTEAVTDLRAADRQAYKENKRLLFVPTFYAAGRVP